MPRSRTRKTTSQKKSAASTPAAHAVLLSVPLDGWAGSVVGLSSIDGKDASENETTRYLKFEQEQWYRIRVRVTDARISAWIDDKQVVDQDIRGRKISTRVEVDLSQPLGIAAYETKAALRDVKYRLVQ